MDWYLNKTILILSLDFEISILINVLLEVTATLYMFVFEWCDAGSPLSLATDGEVHAFCVWIVN